MNILQSLSQTSVISHLQPWVPRIRAHWGVWVGTLEVNTFYSPPPCRRVECLWASRAWVGDLALELAGRDSTGRRIAGMWFPSPVPPSPCRQSSWEGTKDILLTPAHPQNQTSGPSLAFRAPGAPCRPGSRDTAHRPTHHLHHRRALIAHRRRHMRTHSPKHPAWVLSHSPPCIPTSTTILTDFPGSRWGWRVPYSNGKGPLTQSSPL